VSREVKAYKFYKDRMKKIKEDDQTPRTKDLMEKQHKNKQTHNMCKIRATREDTYKYNVKDNVKRKRME
jgi:hypothetical protein